MVSSTFRTTLEGVTYFARVSVSALEGTPGEVLWADELDQQRSLYAAGITDAIERAAAAFLVRGKTPTAIRVEGVDENVVDARPDAVACAAAMACWKAWGGAESALRFETDANGRCITGF